MQIGPCNKGKIWKKREIDSIFQHAVDEIIPQETEIENEKLSVKNETHKYENTNCKINEKYLYGLDKLSFDEDDKERQNHAFERKLENIHDMKRLKII